MASRTLQLFMYSACMTLLPVLANSQSVNHEPSRYRAERTELQNQPLNSLDSMRRSNIIRIRFDTELNRDVVKNLVVEALDNRINSMESISENATICAIFLTTDTEPETPNIVGVYFVVVDSQRTVVPANEILGDERGMLKDAVHSVINERHPEDISIRKAPERWYPPVPFVLLSTGLGLTLVTLLVVSIWCFQVFFRKKVTSASAKGQKSSSVTYSDISRSSPASRL